MKDVLLHVEMWAVFLALIVNSIELYLLKDKS